MNKNLIGGASAGFVGFVLIAFLIGLPVALYYIITAATKSSEKFDNNSSSSQILPISLGIAVGVVLLFGIGSYMFKKSKMN